MGLGKNIKALREQQGLSISDLAERAHIHPPEALRLLETRDSKASKYAGAIAAALGVSLDELHTGSLSSEPQPIPAHYVDCDEIMRLLTLYRQASAKGRSQILVAASVADKATVARTHNVANDKS